MKRLVYASAVLTLGFAIFAAGAMAQVAVPAGTPATAAPQVAVEAPFSPRDLKLIAVGIVEDVPSMDVIRIGKNKITKNGEFTLAGVRTPVPLKDEAVSYLKKTLIGKQVGIFAVARPGDDYTDKYGVARVHVMTAAGRWAQAELVGNGLAYAFSTKENPELIETLYKFESNARKKKLGLWSMPSLQVKTRKNIKDTIGSFQVYEGVVFAHKRSSDTNFAVFGKQSAEDLVLVFRGNNTPAILKNLRPFGFRDMPGRRLRVRGWVENNNDGPMMEITHSQQVEILDPLPRRN